MLAWRRQIGVDRGVLPPINREGIGSWVDILGGGVGGADGRRQGNFHPTRYTCVSAGYRVLTSAATSRHRVGGGGASSTMIPPPPHYKLGPTFRTVQMWQASKWRQVASDYSLYSGSRGIHSNKEIAVAMVTSILEYTIINFLLRLKDRAQY